MNVVAYTDRLSVEPGEALNVMVSCPAVRVPRGPGQAGARRPQSRGARGQGGDRTLANQPSARRAHPAFSQGLLCEGS